MCCLILIAAHTLHHKKQNLVTNNNYSHIDVTNHLWICILDIYHHSWLDILDDLGTASMIIGDSELTSVHPKELRAKAPPVLPFQPCQDSARPCKPWQACGSQPVFIHGNGLCKISSASHQLLAADSYRCPVSSLKRQKKPYKDTMKEIENTEDESRT